MIRIEIEYLSNTDPYKNFNTLAVAMTMATKQLPLKWHFMFSLVYV